MKKRILAILITSLLGICLGFLIDYQKNGNFALADLISNLILGGQNPQDWSNGLVGYWSFDGTTMAGIGATTTDLSGNGNTGTLGSTIASDAGDPTPKAGIIGQGLSFDGVDDYVDCGNDASLNITQEISIEAWFYPTFLPDPHEFIIGKGTFNSNLPWFLTVRQNEVSFMIFKAFPYVGGNYSSVDTSWTPKVNEWHHVVATYIYITDGTSQLRIYIDGVLEGSNNIAVGPMASSPSSSINIGRDGSGSYRWNGLIDEVRIYNRGLTDTEILQHYNLSRRLLKI